MRKILLKCKGVLMGTLVVVCLNGCGNDTAYYVDSEPVNVTEMDNVEESSELETETETQSVYVYICGQVTNPGVYVLPMGSRVCDVLALAGGFTPDAATEYWNQARVLCDGEMIYIPTQAEAKERQSEETNQVETIDTQDDNKVNINTASKEELMTIPGIGEAKAKAILAYREEHGPFSSIEELMNVEGIKDGVFSKMKEYIKIN